MNSLSAQDTESEEQPRPQKALYLYVDCNNCDYDHIRREIPFVNYMRDPQQADIHLFITDESTGDGGLEYELSFIGREQFSGIEFSFKQLVSREATLDETREALNDAIKKGIVPYLLNTAMAGRFTVEYDGEIIGSDRNPEEDPWKQWVFEIYAGSLNLGMESNQTEFDSRWGFYADKVNEDWKLRIRPYFNYYYDEIQRSEDEEPVVSRRHRHGLDSYAIRSLSDHWSAGLFGTYLTRNDQNINHRFQLNPGIEYSLLPYEVATRRAITFTYQVGYTYVEYIEETIFEKLSDNLLNHQISASVGIQQPWGSIYGGLNGSQYFHDFEKRRAEFFGELSVRIVEGLFLNFSTSFEMIRDQLSLPAGDASLEDVLLRQRELSTNFELSGSISLSYTFGSEFANVVNTRF